MNRSPAPNAAARIDWELLPSLRNMLQPRERSYPVWSDTLPFGSDPASPSTPFEEVVPGLEVREVSEPEIFAIFFGRTAATAQAPARR